MGFQKGQPRPPNAGRRAGVPNKSTEQTRQAIARFANDNVDKLQSWLEQTAEGDEVGRRAPDPKGAADLFLRAIEYHIPKLGRQELTGADGEKLRVSVSINLGDKDSD